MLLSRNYIEYTIPLYWIHDAITVSVGYISQSPNPCVTYSFFLILPMEQSDGNARLD